MSDPLNGDRFRLLHGDSRVLLKTLDENSLDSCVTDPPYGLVSIQKRFRKTGSAPAQFGTDGVFQRASKGFMGKEWDGTQIEQDPDFWREVIRVLKPGGYMAAFSGTRTAHRMTCAIEDAGFQIRDSILSLGTLHWVTGQGFPKSKNLDGEWEGFGSALKPAHEPITLAQKPLSEPSIAANVLRWSTGALNINASRVHSAGSEGKPYTVTRLKPGATLNKTGGDWRPEEGGVPYEGRTQDGRWPPNVLMVHSPSCRRRSWGQGSLLNGETVTPNGHDGTRLQNSAAKRQFGYRDDGDEWICSENCPVAELARQSGTSKSPAPGSFQREKTSRGYKGGGFGQARAKDHPPVDLMKPGYSDEGSASRYFPQFSYSDDDLAWPFKYCAKASRSDRSSKGLANNIHPTAKPTELLIWLTRLICPPGGVVLDPFLGSGSTGVACLKLGHPFIGIEQDEEYIRIARARLQQQLPLLTEVEL